MRYKVTKKDFCRSYLLHIKPRKIYSILGVVLICIALSVCLWSVLPIGDKPDIKFASLLLLSIILVLSLLYIYPLYTLHKSYKQTKGIDDDVDLATHEESFSMSGKNFSTTIPYKDIYNIKSNDSYLLIYWNQYFYTILPKTNNDLINAASTIEEKYKAINPTQNNK